MKKHVLCTALCLLSASGAFAAPKVTDTTPKVTEIRLSDFPGYGPNGHLHTEFVFRADGSFDWTKGLGKDAVRHRYTLKMGEFQKLVASLDEQRFFGLKAYYPEGPMVADAPSFTLSATRGGQKKDVTYVYNTLPNSQPRPLWTLEKVLRGVALQTINPQPARAMN